MYKKFIPVNTPLITNNDAKEVYKTVKTGWISSSGIKIKLFENEVANLVDRKFACAVSSGTAALEIAVKSLNLKKNDEVIMPAFTIISNAIAIIKNGTIHIITRRKCCFLFIFIEKASGEIIVYQCGVKLMPFNYNIKK